MSAVTTHVLDTARGVPAAGVLVRLERVSETGGAEIARARTDPGGRASDLGPGALPPGTYRLVFDTAGYFAAVADGGESRAVTGSGAGGAGGESRAVTGSGAGSQGSRRRGAFFPEVAVTFTADAADAADGDPARYHVPLLLSPFGYATYRGS